MCHIYTARINYRGNENQLVLNTTVKNGTGMGVLFAPTWDMVMSFKRGLITWEQYRERYTALMRGRYRNNTQGFLDALLMTDELVLCCYCPDTHETTKQCHRYLLAEILEKVALHHGIAALVIGEVK